MKDNLLPEEKLLKLIKGQPREAPALDKQTVTAGSVNKLYTFFYIRSKNIDKIFSIALIVSCLSLVISLVYPVFGLKKIKLPKIAGNQAVEPKLNGLPAVKPFEFYQKAVQTHRIFGAASYQAQAPASGISVDLIKDINLVGIVAGENPQAILEDKKTKKTYYLNKGQFIEEFQVEDIQTGKIILNYQGQRFELYL